MHAYTCDRETLGVNITIYPMTESKHSHNQENCREALLLMDLQVKLLSSIENQTSLLRRLHRNFAPTVIQFTRGKMYR